MAKKKAKRGEKPARSARWTVRGVPPRLQKAAGEAARARGLTLGQWLCRLLEEGTARDAPNGGGPATSWAEAIEARLARLEARLGEPAAATDPPASDPAAPLSGSPRVGG